MTERTVVVGRVHSVAPGKRQLRIRPADGPFPEEAFLGWLRVRTADGRETRSRVASMRECAGAVVVELTPGTPRDAVAQMKGGAVVWDPPEGFVLEAVFDLDALLDMRLVDNRGETIGTVVGVLETPAHGVAEVQRPDGSRFLLPVIPEAIERMDWEGGQMVAGDIAPYAVDDEN